MEEEEEDVREKVVNMIAELLDTNLMEIDKGLHQLFRLKPTFVRRDQLS